MAVPVQYEQQDLVALKGVISSPLQSREAISNPQISNTIVMVRPIDFTFNEETAQDNEFMNNVQNIQKTEILRQAIQEFDNSVALIKNSGINVIVFDKSRVQGLENVSMPDAVFPNNWFVTDHDGNVYVFPLASENRRKEALQLPYIVDQLIQEGFDIKSQIQMDQEFRLLSNLRNEDEYVPKYLEGTGSMIIDHSNKIIYACLSKRTNDEALQMLSKMWGHKIVAFDSYSSTGIPFYHTNIIMCIGVTFVAICLESIPVDQRETVKQSILASNKEIIELTQEQVEKSFCGNMLQVRSETNPEQTYIIMSERASKGLTEEQNQKFAKHGVILPLPIDIIEVIGGGSARCMLAEIHLPRK